MIFELVEAEKARYPVVQTCRVLEVSPSHFYRWRAGWRSKKAIEDTVLLSKIQTIHKDNRGRSGNRRITLELREQGETVGRHRVARIMRESSLRGKMKARFRNTTVSDHDHPVADNLLDRNFNPASPNLAWAGDITYLRTNEGWLYLAVVLDLHSRKVVGWAMGIRINRQLCLDALRMGIWRRKPKRGLLFHSDRGVQYASKDFQKALKKAGMTCSMSRKGNCWDNAPVESFFSTLKRELFFEEPVFDRETTAQRVFEYIETYYNRKRLHSSLDYKSPEAFERLTLDQPAAKVVA